MVGIAVGLSGDRERLVRSMSILVALDMMNLRSEVGVFDEGSDL